MQEGPVTPLLTDGHPFSDGGGPDFRGMGASIRVTCTPAPWDSGTIFRVEWDPYSAGRGTPSQRNVGKEILVYPRRMTNRWRIVFRPFAGGEVEGMDWIR